jgi:uncharacterized membrane protein YphA (DoxX/SURF4 family)
MRLAAGLVLTGHVLAQLRTGVATEPAVLYLLAIADALLLFVGLWTPIAGLMLAAFELWAVFLQPADPSAKLLLAILGIALALIGPGAWSIDARLYGWKRIEFTNQR